MDHQIQKLACLRLKLQLFDFRSHATSQPPTFTDYPPNVIHAGGAAPRDAGGDRRVKRPLGWRACLNRCPIG